MLAADVRETNGTCDLAVILGPDRLAVVRCADQVNRDDHIALATMIADGDFAWAALIHSRGDTAPSDARIQSFHISELDGLVAVLRGLGATRS